MQHSSSVTLEQRFCSSSSEVKQSSCSSIEHELCYSATAALHLPVTSCPAPATHQLPCTCHSPAALHLPLTNCPAPATHQLRRSVEQHKLQQRVCDTRHQGRHAHLHIATPRHHRHGPAVISSSINQYLNHKIIIHGPSFHRNLSNT